MAELRTIRKASFAANTAFSVAAWGAPLAFAFIATPYLIHGLGIEQYGYYSIVLAVIGFGFTTGIGKVTAKYIPELRASDRTNELSQILFASLLLTIAVSILEGVTLAAATSFIVEGTLNVPGAAQTELKTAIHIASLIGPATMISQFFQSSAQGLHLFRASSVIALVVALGLNSGSIFLAVNSYSYSVILIWNLGVAVTALTAYVVLVRRYLPELTPGFSTTAAIFRKVGRFTFSIFIYQTITSVLFIFERAFVLRNFGAEALTFYTVPLMLGIYLHGLIISFSQAVVPKMNEDLNRPRELAEIYRFSTRVVLAVASLVSLGYFVIGRDFLGLWLGEEFAARSFSLLVLQGVAFSLIAISINCWMLAEAAHHYGINALSSSITSVIGIAIILLLSPAFGLDGVASGRLIGAAVVLPLIPFLETRVFGSPMFQFWLINIGKVAAASFVAILIGVIAKSFFGASWPTFVLTAGAITISFGLSLYLLRYFSFGGSRKIAKVISS